MRWHHLSSRRANKARSSCRVPALPRTLCTCDCRVCYVLSRNSCLCHCVCFCVCVLGSRAPIVLEGPAEWQKMNDLELRSRLRVIAEQVGHLQRDLSGREKEIDRLSGQVTTLSGSLSNKDRAIADLTVKLSTALTSKEVAADGGIGNVSDGVCVRVSLRLTLFRSAIGLAGAEAEQTGPGHGNDGGKPYVARCVTLSDSCVRGLTRVCVRRSGCGREGRTYFGS